jgi:hypothetical protein
VNRDYWDAFDSFSRIGLSSLPILAYILYWNSPGSIGRATFRLVPLLTAVVVVSGLALTFRRLGDPRFLRNQIVYGLLGLGLYLLLSPILISETLLDKGAALTSYVLPSEIQGLFDVAASVLRWETCLLISLAFSLGEETGRLFWGLCGLLLGLFLAGAPHVPDLVMLLLWFLGVYSAWTPRLEILVPNHLLVTLGLTASDAEIMTAGFDCLLEAKRRKETGKGWREVNQQELFISAYAHIADGLVSSKEADSQEIDGDTLLEVMRLADGRLGEIEDGSPHALSQLVSAESYQRFLAVVMTLGSATLLCMSVVLIALGSFIPGPVEEFFALALSSPAFLMLGRLLGSDTRIGAMHGALQDFGSQRIVENERRGQVGLPSSTSSSSQ